MKEKKVKINSVRLFNGIICGILAAGMFTLGFFTREWSLSKAVREAKNVLDVIEKNYVGDFDEDQFIASAVAGSLDRYSAYYTPVEYDEVNLRREGISQGVIGISLYSGTNTIARVSGNSPAERAGITEGGSIVGIKLSEEAGYSAVSDSDSFYAVYDNAKKGEPIFLKISYGEDTEEYTVKRGDYTESYVWYQNSSASYNFTLEGGEWKMAVREKPLKTNIIGGFAYIKLSSFNGAAAKQVSAALADMKDKGIKKLVLDLRSNGGGYMDILTEIAGYLVPGKDRQLISSAVYKSGSKDEFCTSRNYYSRYDYERITVLCNSGTASASEALIGAMLDYDEFYGKNIVRVIVSGSKSGVFRTYGKGIMQTTFQLPGGAAVKLTTAKIYWPTSGKCIHGEGITPDTDARVTGIMTEDGTDAEFAFAMTL